MHQGSAGLTDGVEIARARPFSRHKVSHSKSRGAGLAATEAEDRPGGRRPLGGLSPGLQEGPQGRAMNEDRPPVIDGRQAITNDPVADGVAVNVEEVGDLLDAVRAVLSGASRVESGAGQCGASLAVEEAADRVHLDQRPPAKLDRLQPTLPDQGIYGRAAEAEGPGGFIDGKGDGVQSLAPFLVERGKPALIGGSRSEGGSLKTWPPSAPQRPPTVAGSRPLAISPQAQARVGSNRTRGMAMANPPPPKTGNLPPA